MKLTADLNQNNSIEYNGEIIELDLCFDNVLRALELRDDSTFNDYEKFIIWLDMFVLDDSILKSLDEQSLLEILDAIFKKIIDSKDESETSESSNGDIKLFCFIQDSEYIYSSFKAEYGVDLIDEQGKLNWFKFLSLLKGLPDKSKFKEILGIRAQKIPKYNRHNKEEIKRIRELKRLYQLKLTPEEMKKKADMLNDKFSYMGEAIIKKAGVK